MRQRINPTFIVLLVLLMLAGQAQSQPARQGWQYELEAGATHGWSAGMATGGDVTVDAWSTRLGIRYAWPRGFSAGITAGVGEERFNFDPNPGPSPTETNAFSTSAPWSNIRNARLSAPLFWRPNQRWNLFAVPTLRWNAEQGASLDDGRGGGLLAAASYRVNDRLSIGPGFGVFSELEDDNSWFPILAIDWRITDRLSLSTGRGFAASQGPGLALRWDVSDQWNLSLGGRYEKDRFRLDDRGVAPGGVGETTSTTLYLVATRNIGRLGTVSALTGVDLNGALRLEDAAGDLLDRTDVDDAPFIGVTMKLRF
jgi:hypothetical protein